MSSQTRDHVSLPVIDISIKNPSAPEQLLNAAAQYGFVYIENNEIGIAPQDIDQIFRLSETFFASPPSEKEEVSINSNLAGKNHGWLSRGVEKLDPASQKRPDVKEAFNMGEPIDGRPQQPMPRALQAHTQTILDFQNACHALCQRLLELFARALDIERDWFTSRHDQSKGPSGSVFRLLYYPRVDDAEDGVDVRAGSHTDYGSITLLFQQRGQPGLEIQTPGGEWAAVPVDPADERRPPGRALPILVNIGDLLEDWTGGLLKSTVHRVVFPPGGAADRYSIAFFCHPLDEALLEPVPSPVVERHTARLGDVETKKGTVITARDHLMERLAATYKIK